MPKEKTPATGLPEAQRLDWVLRFLRLDIAATGPGELLDWRNAVFTHLHEPATASVSGLTGRELRALRRSVPGQVEDVVASARALLTDIQTTLRTGLDALDRAGTWEPFAQTDEAPRWVLERTPDGVIRRAYHGTWSAVTIATTADVLTRAWAQLRRCEHCRAWFLPRHGRQTYHDARCSWEARYARFRPTRDYKDEYARRHGDRDKKRPVREQARRKR